MVTAEVRQRRRGSRRADATGSSAVPSGNPQGFIERILSFETYTGFPHQEIGVLVGLLHAIDLWTRRGGKNSEKGSGHG